MNLEDGPLPVKWVRREALEPNEYNPSVSGGTEREVLRNSLKDSGWTRPLLVQPDGTIINGESRWFVSRHPDIREDESLTPDNIGPGHVPVFVVDVDEETAMAMTYQHNAAVGETDDSQLADLIREMDEEQYAYDRLELEPEEVDIAEETGTDVSDIDFEDDTDEGAFTETIEFEVGDQSRVHELLGEVSGERLAAFARFIVVTDLYEEADVQPPDWDRIPET